MGTLKYFTFDGTFRLHTVESVCRVRFTDSNGTVASVDDSQLREMRRLVLRYYMETIT